MQNLDKQKIKLQQKKARMAIEETKLKLKEQKARTKLLIEHGGLITKAGLDHLSTNSLYGALLSLNEQINSNPQIRDNWDEKGKLALAQEQSPTTPIIVKFKEDLNNEIKNSIRAQGLRYNKFRSEWYGNVVDIESLKNSINGINHNLEILDDLS